MAYKINVTMPAGTDFYVGADKNNPTEIEAGQTVTLKFNADGTYYTLIKPPTTAFSVVGATVDNWVCASPYRIGELTISNPTSDVEININARVSIVPTALGGVFRVGVKAPIDTRLVLTKEQMRDTKTSKQPDVYFAICKDDSQLYIWNNTFEPSPETGWFKPYADIIATSEISEEAKEEIAAMVKATLADEESIILLEDDGTLSIKGYKEATHGQMVVKDVNKGLVWKDPVDIDTINEATKAAEAQARAAANSAIEAGNALVDAEKAVIEAKEINAGTIDMVESKFWAGTIEEYNSLEAIKEDVFYFVQL